MTQQPLSPDDLLSAPTLRRLGRAVHVFRTVSSTNDYLLRHADYQADGALAFAEHQTAGRGRLGRVWEDPRGASILLSVLIREPANSPFVSGAALVGALATCEAVREVTGVESRLRWPNDVTVGGRKLAGVLAETAPLSGAQRAVVVGIGMNCLQQAGHFPVALRAKATSLEICCPEAVDRAAVAAAVVARLDHWFSRPRGEWDATVRAWRDLCDDFGRHIELSRNDRRFTGTVIDIETNGDLILEVDRGGRQSFGAATTARGW